MNTDGIIFPEVNGCSDEESPNNADGPSCSSPIGAVRQSNVCRSNREVNHSVSGSSLTKRMSSFAARCFMLGSSVFMSLLGAGDCTRLYSSLTTGDATTGDVTTGDATTLLPFTDDVTTGDATTSSSLVTTNNMYSTTDFYDIDRSDSNMPIFILSFLFLIGIIAVMVALTRKEIRKCCGRKRRGDGTAVARSFICLKRPGSGSYLELTEV